MSYVSRISNETVRATLQTLPLKNALLKRQLLYLGSVARRPAGIVLRDMLSNIFNPNNVSLRAQEDPAERVGPNNCVLSRYMLQEVKRPWLQYGREQLTPSLHGSKLYMFIAVSKL